MHTFEDFGVRVAVCYHNTNSTQHTEEETADITRTATATTRMRCRRARKKKRQILVRECV